MPPAAQKLITQERLLTEKTLLRLTLGFFLASHVGAHVDAWYHTHHGFEIESFLTWPHALFYAGRAGTITVLGVYLIESVMLRAPRRRWLPAGFPLILLSTILFLLGGVFDFGWHALFGFEATLAALLSPAHIWLNVSALLFALGLIQATLDDRQQRNRPADGVRPDDIPVLLGVAILFRVTMWNVLYADPLGVDYASGGALVRRLPAYADIQWDGITSQVAGTTGIVTHSIVLALFLLLIARWLCLPGGAIAAVMLWNGLLTAMVSDSWLYLPAVAMGAAAGEVIWAFMRRGQLGGVTGELGYWVLAGVTPIVEFFSYFGIMHAVGGGIVWPTHLWAGAPVLGALYGVMTALIVVPPRFIRRAALF